MTETIIVNVAPSGDVHIEAQGFTGVTCAQATERLELLLGGGMRKGDKKYKPEYSLPSQTGIKTNNRL